MLIMSIKMTTKYTHKRCGYCDLPDNYSLSGDYYQ